MSAQLAGAPVVAARSGEPGLPVGFGVVLDDSTKQLEPDVWFGGAPARVLRLTASGLDAWAQLRTGPVRSAGAARLGRRLTDAGLAHPVPPRVLPAADVTVLVPVLDRPAELARCLAALGGEYPVIVVDDGSRDPDPVRAVAARFGAEYVRREVNGGPGAARNTGLEQVRTRFVAFLDSDCIAPRDWLAPLLAHLGDPLVAAVAPRITAIAGQTWAGRYTAARGSLDLGSRPGRVLPGGRVSYVPTAALVARCSALHEVATRGHVFDPALRVGEDVDLVWRLDAAGHRVRYDPDVHVGHQEPATWTALWRRRFSYGTSAAALSLAHPGDAAPLVVYPWQAATVLALLARRPVPAAAAFAVSVRSTRRRLQEADVPTCGTAVAMGSAVRQTWLGMARYATQFAAPALLAATVTGGRGRRLAAASLLLGPPLAAWAQQRRTPGPACRTLDPVRFVLAHLADEIAYGAGVWAGCLAHRTTTPVRPAMARRPRRVGTRPAVASTRRL